ncbi:DNA recombination/repair protein RecA [Candidatus Pacearchaeota archaeon]|nr:DNA recombination/repair protein RecA [Candidatus Pacearchaeota archaeon]
MAKAKKIISSNEEEIKNTDTGRLSSEQIRNLINSKAGTQISYDLEQESPTEVIDWIPTGSTWLDAIICRGKLGGIPVGKISECAGLESTGKSFFAAQIAANAQKKGYKIVYFDSENAIDPDFLKRSGCDISVLQYIQPSSIEEVFEIIETLLSIPNEKWFFIWDSLAMTPSKADSEGDFELGGTISQTARVVSLGMKKLIIPIGKTQSTLLVLNQLKTNINPKNPGDMLVNPYFTPGGKSVLYAYSLRIWLTKSDSKANLESDESGHIFGNRVKVKIKKSRFGSLGRECEFKIQWGIDPVGVQNEDSLYDALSESFTKSGSWGSFIGKSGGEWKFQRKSFIEMLKTNDEFKKDINYLVETDIIRKLDKLPPVLEGSL